MTATRACRHIIDSRMLILQSKRMMLSSLQRRLEYSGADSLRDRVAKLRRELETARRLYGTTILALGDPKEEEFWLVAYGTLVERASTLIDDMRGTSGTLSAADRYQVCGDVEALEGILARWRESLRATMGAGTAA